MFISFKRLELLKWLGNSISIDSVLYKQKRVLKPSIFKLYAVQKLSDFDFISSNQGLKSFEYQYLF